MRKKLRVLFLSCLSLLLLTVPVGAETATTTVNVTVIGGLLNIDVEEPTIDLGSITIDGKTQTLAMDLGTMKVLDFTGMGAGWHVTVEATPFTNGAKELPKNSLKLLGIESISPINEPKGMPSFDENTSYVLDGGTAQTIITAEKGMGMGEFNVEFAEEALKLTVNTAQILASETPYKSIITYTIVAGP